MTIQAVQTLAAVSVFAALLSLPGIALAFSLAALVAAVVANVRVNVLDQRQRRDLVDPLTQDMAQLRGRLPDDVD